MNQRVEYLSGRYQVLRDGKLIIVAAPEVGEPFRLILDSGAFVLDGQWLQQIEGSDRVRIVRRPR